MLEELIREVEIGGLEPVMVPCKKEGEEYHFDLEHIDLEVQCLLT